uniref:Nicotinamide-nucleotide adenylyltransferase n=1 Tax=Macrostomum lignano TaxID=282301 RepID=A0A1I8J6A9_9PLAT
MTGGGDLPVHNVLLVACGSFNPVTNMHLRMFELARDALTRTGRFRVLGGLVSPVSDAYSQVAQLEGLAAVNHRLEMIRLALQPPSREGPAAWVRLARWEARLADWTPTRRVLDHYQAVMDCGPVQQGAEVHAGATAGASAATAAAAGAATDDYRWLTGLLRRLRLKDPLTVAHPMLLCGSDMLKSFAVPGLWTNDDLVKILRDYGLIVITKPSCNPQQIIFENDLLNTYEQNIALVTEWTVNELSSAFVRRALRRRESVRYLLPDPVIEYIYRNALYQSTAERPRLVRWLVLSLYC